MTKDEWLSLKPGDVIVETASNIERTVLSVAHNRRPGHIKTRTSITLRKISYGWTKGPNTTYNSYDDRGRWSLVTKDSVMKTIEQLQQTNAEAKRKKVIVQDGTVTINADAIRELAEGVRKMRANAKDKLIVLLLNDETGLPRRDIQMILDAIPELERIYFKAK